MLFFTSILVITFILNYKREFYLNINGLTILKRPYIISIARFVEYMACITFSIVIYKTIIYYREKGVSFNYILEAILKANILFAVLFIGVFLLAYFNFIPLENSILLYDTTPYTDPTIRLRGFYVEGGPLGLLFCMFYILSFFLQKKKWILQILSFTVILLAQSKAGLVGVLAWHTYQFYTSFKHSKWLKPIIVLLIAPIFYILFMKIIVDYIQAYNNFFIILPYHMEDYNLIMGRIAAVFIIPKMFAENPLFGIGLGNYAIVRNNPYYLGPLPSVDEWDAPGLGAFVTLLIDNGIFGFVAFLLILYSMYRNYSKASTVSASSLKVFVLICLLGVQLHFLYIWFLIGLAIAAPEDNIKTLNAPQA